MRKRNSHNSHITLSQSGQRSRVDVPSKAPAAFDNLLESEPQTQTSHEECRTSQQKSYRFRSCRLHSQATTGAPTVCVHGLVALLVLLLLSICAYFPMPDGVQAASDKGQSAFKQCDTCPSSLPPALQLRPITACDCSRPAHPLFARRGGREGDDDVTPPPVPPPALPPPQKGTVNLIDPRENGLEVTLGEWAVVLESYTIRPGEVTFVIRNRGSRSHGFRIRSQAARGRDRFESRTRLLSPGETSTLAVNLSAGTYRVDCYVEEAGVGDHAALGMRATLTVSPDAPLMQIRSEATGPDVTIANFSYAPQSIKVSAGTTVTWTNNDQTLHTVTAEDGSFDSGVLGQGATYKRAFEQPGTYPYRCTLHPQMQGIIEVTP